MKYKLTGIIILLLCITFPCKSQKRGAVWCFGDSALVDFTDTSNVLVGHSAVKSRGSCVSISDSVGNLIMYAYTRAGVNGNTTWLKNNQDSLVQFGDSIVGEGWYRELVLLPYADSDSLYILFSIGVTGSSQMGCYFSIVDMSLNSGLGAVIQKNVQLENFKTVDCLTAIKHGNGRDWWVMYRRWNNSPSAPNNEWYECLISPSGLIQQPLQNVGSIQSSGFGNIVFNASGTKIAYINYPGLIELYDFDRCTGVISNPVTIAPESTQAPWPAYWSAEFSPSGDLLYTTRIAASSTDSCYLTQFDLTSANIPQSATVLWQTSFLENMGQLKLAENGKIYLSNNYGGGYPYSDSLYNFRNMNLSVINSPDSLGTACDLQPYSFYLGGKRTYFGLPNNPDYDMPALAGSSCETLVGMGEIPEINSAAIHAFYHTSWQKVFINASGLKGNAGMLMFYDMQGKEIHKEPLRIQNGYYTKDLSMIGNAKGTYVVVVQTEKERLVKKFVIE